jgi:hypothetical protein
LALGLPVPVPVPVPVQGTQFRQNERTPRHPAREYAQSSFPPIAHSSYF